MKTRRFLLTIPLAVLHSFPTWHGCLFYAHCWVYTSVEMPLTIILHPDLLYSLLFKLKEAKAQVNCTEFEFSRERKTLLITWHQQAQLWWQSGIMVRILNTEALPGVQVSVNRGHLWGAAVSMDWWGSVNRNIQKLNYKHVWMQKYSVMTNILMQYARPDFDINFTLEIETKYGVMRSNNTQSAVQGSLKKLSVLHTSLPPCFQRYFWHPFLHSSPSKTSMMCCHCLAAGFTQTTTAKQHKAPPPANL